MNWEPDQDFKGLTSPRHSALISYTDIWNSKTLWWHLPGLCKQVLAISSVFALSNSFMYHAFLQMCLASFQPLFAQFKSLNESIYIEIVLAPTRTSRLKQKSLLCIYESHVRITSIYSNLHDLPNSITEIPEVRVQVSQWQVTLRLCVWQYACVGEGTQLHMQPSHQTLVQPQCLIWGTLTDRDNRGILTTLHENQNIEH